MEFNLANPDPSVEEYKHKLKKLIQKPNSYFLDVKCKNCTEILHTFSHAQSVIKCPK